MPISDLMKWRIPDPVVSVIEKWDLDKIELDMQRWDRNERFTILSIHDDISPRKVEIVDLIKRHPSVIGLNINGSVGDVRRLHELADQLQFISIEPGACDPIDLSCFKGLVTLGFYKARSVWGWDEPTDSRIFRFVGGGKRALQAEDVPPGHKVEWVEYTFASSIPRLVSQNLGYLQLLQSPTKQDWSFLKPVELSLEVLKVELCKGLNLEALPALPNLKSIHLTNCGPVRDYSFLERHPSLESVIVSGTPSESADVSWIKALPLSHRYIEHKRHYDSRIEFLDGLNKKL